MSSMGTSDLKVFGVLVVSLFVLAILFALSYIGVGYLKEVACEQGDTGYYWTGSVCQVSSTNTTVVTPDALTAIGTVKTGMDIALGLLSLVIVVAIFGVLVKMARGFKAGGL